MDVAWIARKCLWAVGVEGIFLYTMWSKCASEVETKLAVYAVGSVGKNAVGGVGSCLCRGVLLDSLESGCRRLPSRRMWMLLVGGLRY